MENLTDKITITITFDRVRATDNDVVTEGLLDCWYVSAFKKHILDSNRLNRNPSIEVSVSEPDVVIKGKTKTYTFFNF